MSPLRRFWKRWKAFGHALGTFQARVLLTLFYGVLLVPFALAVRLFADPLAIKPGAPRGWRVRAGATGDPLERARRQF